MLPMQEFVATCKQHVTVSLPDNFHDKFTAVPYCLTSPFHSTSIWADLPEGESVTNPRVEALEGPSAVVLVAGDGNFDIRTKLEESGALSPVISNRSGHPSKMEPELGVPIRPIQQPVLFPPAISPSCICRNLPTACPRSDQTRMHRARARLRLCAKTHARVYLSRKKSLVLGADASSVYKVVRGADLQSEMSSPRSSRTIDHFRLHHGR